MPSRRLRTSTSRSIRRTATPWIPTPSSWPGSATRTRPAARGRTPPSGRARSCRRATSSSPSGAFNGEGRPQAPLDRSALRRRLRGGAARGRRRRRGRRGVLELLLLAEERVEHLVAQVLAHAERHAGADDEQHQRAAEAPLLLLLGALAQRVGGLLEVLGGLLDALLQLLVVEERLVRRLAVGQPLEGVPAGLVRELEVLAHVLVLDHPLDRGAGLRLCRDPGRAAGGLGRLLLGCHQLSTPIVVPTGMAGAYPGSDSRIIRHRGAPGPLTPHRWHPPRRPRRRARPRVRPRPAPIPDRARPRCG